MPGFKECQAIESNQFFPASTQRESSGKLGGEGSGRMCVGSSAGGCADRLSFLQINANKARIAGCFEHKEETCVEECAKRECVASVHILNMCTGIFQHFSTFRNSKDRKSLFYFTHF